MTFRTLQRVHERLQDAVEFHLIGTKDSHRYPEYRLVENFTTVMAIAARRRCDHEQVPRRDSHVLVRGPVLLLARIAVVWSPDVAVSLPQYALVVEDGRSVPSSTAGGKLAET